MSLVDKIIGVESGGDPNARNSRSSAAGLGQFIDSTWENMISKYRPDIQGSREEILGLKTDPQLSRQMTEAYAAENGAILSKAGHQATPGNTYLAHFAGPQGAVSVLSASPDTPVSAILTPGAISANPFLKGMTAGDLQGWAARKVGDKAFAPAIMGQSKPQPVDLASRIMGSEPQAAPQPAQQQPVAQPYQPPQEQPSLLSQMEAPSPVFAPGALPINIASLLKASGNRGSFFKG